MRTVILAEDKDLVDELRASLSYVEAIQVAAVIGHRQDLAELADHSDLALLVALSDADEDQVIAEKFEWFKQWRRSRRASASDDSLLCPYERGFKWVFGRPRLRSFSLESSWDDGSLFKDSSFMKFYVGWEEREYGRPLHRADGEWPRDLISTMSEWLPQPNANDDAFEERGRVQRGRPLRGSPPTVRFWPRDVEADTCLFKAIQTLKRMFNLKPGEESVSVPVSDTRQDLKVEVHLSGYSQNFEPDRKDYETVYVLGNRSDIAVLRSLSKFRGIPPTSKFVVIEEGVQWARFERKGGQKYWLSPPNPFVVWDCIWQQVTEFWSEGS